MTHVKSRLTGQSVYRQNDNNYLVKGQTNTRHSVTKQQKKRHDEFRHANLTALATHVFATAGHGLREARNLGLLSGLIQVRVNLRSLAHNLPPRSTRA